MDVAYIGTDQHVHELLYNGAWFRNDLTLSAGAPNAASNASLAAAANTFANTMEVDYIGTDQHVHQLWYNGFWHTQDLSAIAGAPNAAAGSLLTTAADSIGNTMDVEYIGTDRHVHQLWYNGGFWRHTDLTATTGAANANGNAGLVTSVNTFANTMEVDYIASDQHVHQLWYNGFWHTQDLSAIAAAPKAASDSPLTSAADSVGNTMDVEYVGTDHHVHQLWYSGGFWWHNDLTATTGAPAAASGAGLKTIVNTFANTMEVDYIGTDQHVHQFWYDGTWFTQDLSAVAGAPPASANSPLTSAVDPIGNTVDIEYVGTDQHVHQLYYSGGFWRTTDLTVASGS